MKLFLSAFTIIIQKQKLFAFFASQVIVRFLTISTSWHFQSITMILLEWDGIIIEMSLQNLERIIMPLQLESMLFLNQIQKYWTN